MQPPLPGAGARWALFLDLDGTLAELAAHPDEAVVPRRVRVLLARLQELLGGALAVVTGRRIDSVDRMLHPMRPAAAGLHGLERRNGERISALAPDPGLAAVRQELEALAAAYEGLMLEDKGSSLALHFRNAPGLEDLCRERSQAAARHVPRYHVLCGKMVFEIKPGNANRGEAMRILLNETPFQGRVPVFAGDDRTDEDGFRWINDSGGISIKVGEGETLARYRVADVPAFHQWLARTAVHLDVEGNCP